MDLALLNVECDVLFRDLDNDKSEESKNETLISDLVPLAHSGPCLLQVFEYLLPVLELVIDPRVNLLELADLRVVEVQLLNVLLYQELVESLDLKRGQPFLSYVGFEVDALVRNELFILEIGHLILLLQVVDQHHQVCSRGEVATLFPYESVGLEEEEPEVGEGEEFLLVHKEVEVEKFSEEELSA